MFSWNVSAVPSLTVPELPASWFSHAALTEMGFYSQRQIKGLEMTVLCLLGNGLDGFRADLAHKLLWLKGAALGRAANVSALLRLVCFSLKKTPPPCKLKPKGSPLVILVVILACGKYRITFGARWCVMAFLCFTKQSLRRPGVWVLGFWTAKQWLAYLFRNISGCFFP